MSESIVGRLERERGFAIVHCDKLDALGAEIGSPVLVDLANNMVALGDRISNTTVRLRSAVPAIEWRAHVTLRLPRKDRP